jgi:predicted permease
MHIVNTLAPIFIIVALGALLTRFNFIDAAARRVINACCYWIGLPCLLALKIGTADAVGSSAGVTITIVICGTVVLMLAGGAAGLLLRLDARSLATFVHVTFRGNLAYIGLPVICFAFAGTEFADKAEPVAAITLGIMVIIYNVVAVIIHLLSTHAMTPAAIKKVMLKLFTNPLLISCAAGFIWNRFFHANNIAVPLVIERTMVLLGQFALPMALLCVGSALASTKIRASVSGAGFSAILKTVAGPAIAFGAARLLGADPMETGIAAILLGAPTAIASYVLTEQLDGNAPLAATAIVVSTLVSAATFSIVILLIG